VKRRVIGSVLGSAVVAALLLAAVPAAAIEDDEYNQVKQADASVSAEAGAPSKVPWRNSYFTYSHQLSALTFSKGAELRHDPYYAQSLTFRPRYYVRDDLSLRARLDLEIELTTSDSTDTIREWVVSDLLFDVNYAPTWMVIPYAKIAVNPSLQFAFPTSKVSRGRSLMMSLAPGVAFRRSFDLLKGKYLKNIGLTYAFRATKYFHEFANPQLSDQICGGVALSDPNSPFADTGCIHSGSYNRSWRFTNSLGFMLSVMDKLAVSGALLFIYDALYTGSAREVDVGGGIVSLDETRINHRASTWFILDVSYDLFEWLSLSAGVSTFHPQLDNESKLYPPFFNRFTAFFFDVNVPVDKFVSQVQTWTGWGR